ncbi:putative RNA-directed DNA polymerase, eukaryota, reverse transcriptase zinc-binding domain protein [Tanacetum coccineum]
MSNIEKHKLMIFKVDFEKAFDSVNWKFLQNIMRQMGFGEKWRKRIGACLSSASISVLINGSPSKEFKMERGLRQGDPLSPFLFLLVVEALQIAILEACSKGFFKGVSLAEGGVNISLLQYADDALFFGEWSRLNAKNLILILKCFENASGLKINLSKSRLFGIGVPEVDVEMVASSLGCIHDYVPFMYLGLLLGKKMRFCDGWNEVVNRFRVRLSSWKSKTLSIGVDSLFAKNLALLGKWKWRFLTEKDALWRLVIKHFYRDDGGFGSSPGSNGNTGTWCDILKAVKGIEGIDSTFKNSFCLKVSNGLLITCLDRFFTL